MQYVWGLQIGQYELISQLCYKIINVAIYNTKIFNAHVNLDNKFCDN